ncbi:MAG TPA: hypothetical protein DEG88_07520 [Propionibacteriaceae bacterium]|nr:hypothetical protein [Propionibacteriaceae bacterium]HBY23123.1 hypothetical protein [Propionibacteriaceae bacterium]
MGSLWTTWTPWPLHRRHLRADGRLAVAGFGFDLQAPMEPGDPAASALPGYAVLDHAVAGHRCPITRRPVIGALR